MRKVDFTNLIEGIMSADNLIDPELQTEHPIMKELMQILFYNLMDGNEQQLYNNIATRHGVDTEKAWYLFGKQDKKHHKRDEVEDTLFTGLMNDHQYKDFMREKKEDSSLTARRYFNSYIRDYASSGMKKLAKAFDAFLSKKAPEKPVKYMTKQDFLAMNPEERKANFERAMKSYKLWR